MKCNPHPNAPHGFLRQASHDAGRYVCECEWWSEKDYELATLEEAEAYKAHWEKDPSYECYWRGEITKIG